MLSCRRRPGGVIGSHARLKILWSHGRAGSTPASGTNKSQTLCLAFLVEGGSKKVFTYEHVVTIEV